MLKQKGRQLSITDIDVLEQWSNRPLVSENSTENFLTGGGKN